MNNTQDIEVHSITHEHILTILLSELHDRKDVAPGGCIQILDVGCGNGDLIRYIHQSLIQAFPSLEVAIHGLDVVDSGVQDQAYQVKTLQHLTAAVTDVQWGKRLHFISQNQQWPFPPNTFDFVLSNQVLEHVSNHETFFANQHRVMKDSGIAVHLFPLEEVLWEAHLHLPFVHRIKNWERLCKWIEIFSKLGIGKWKRSGVPLTEYSKGHADYLLHYTNYLSKARILGLSKGAGLRASFAYTGGFYLRKLGRISGINLVSRSRRSTLFDVFFFPIFKRISSVTLFQTKGNVYKRFE